MHQIKIWLIEGVETYWPLYYIIKPYHSVVVLVCTLKRLVILQKHADWISWQMKANDLKGKLINSEVQVLKQSPYSLHQQYLNMAYGPNWIHRNFFQKLLTVSMFMEIFTGQSMISPCEIQTDSLTCLLIIHHELKPCSL